MKTLSIDRSLKLTPLLHTPRHTNPPNYFPLWSLSGNQRLEQESEVKNKHCLTSAGYSLCRRCSFHIRRRVSQCRQVESVDNAASSTSECLGMRWHHGSLHLCPLRFQSDGQSVSRRTWVEFADAFVIRWMNQWIIALMGLSSVAVASLPITPR